jgi:predicted transcriptional regulator
MDDKSKLLLQEMIRANNVEDQTENIRALKHSVLLRKDIERLLEMMKETSDPMELHIEAMMECNFIFTYYTDIYNKIRKEEIDLGILFRFLNVFEKIENGTIDQHEGSFEVGTLLKELYVDSALKKAKKLDEQYKEEVVQVEPKDIGWKNYKKVMYGKEK